MWIPAAGTKCAGSQTLLIIRNIEFVQEKKEKEKEGKKEKERKGEEEEEGGEGEEEEESRFLCLLNLNLTKKSLRSCILIESPGEFVYGVV